MHNVQILLRTRCAVSPVQIRRISKAPDAIDVLLLSEAMRQAGRGAMMSMQP